MNQQHNTLRLTKRGERVAAGTALALLSTVAVGGAFYEHAHNNQERRQQRVEAQRQVDGISDEVIVLKSGATYRSTPDTVNASNQSADVEPDNRLGQVPKGKEWIVRLPSVSSEHPGWIGFVKPGEDVQHIDSLNDRADKTVWVNYDALEAQGYAHDTAYQGVQGGIMAAKVANSGTIQLLQGKGSADNLSASIALEAAPEAGSVIGFMYQGFSDR